MTRTALAGHRVLGAGEVACADPAQYNRNAKSLYADPVAWLAVEAADRALKLTPEVMAAGEDTAVLAVSAECTIATMRSIAQRIRSGRLSPLNFAGANPGLLAGAVCMTWGLRGPSLTLTMPPALGRDTALAVAEDWLGSSQARYVLILTHEIRGTEHVARCDVLGAPR